MLSTSELMEERNSAILGTGPRTDTAMNCYGETRYFIRILLSILRMLKL